MRFEWSYGPADVYTDEHLVDVVSGVHWYCTGFSDDGFSVKESGMILHIKQMIQSKLNFQPLLCICFPRFIYFMCRNAYSAPFITEECWLCKLRNHGL